MANDIDINITNIMNNDRFNTASGIPATTYTRSWDVIPDLGAAGRRGSSTWLDNSVRRHLMNHCRKTHPQNSEEHSRVE
jgi:hypothetical protein